MGIRCRHDKRQLNVSRGINHVSFISIQPLLQLPERCTIIRLCLLKHDPYLTGFSRGSQPFQFAGLSRLITKERSLFKVTITTIKFPDCFQALSRNSQFLISQGHFRRNFLPGRPDTTTAQLRFLRSEENTSDLQSLMRTSSAVFCLKKKKNTI